jgi:hypothetical protein
MTVKDRTDFSGSICTAEASTQSDTHVEAGLNTSTVTLRLVGGGEKGSLKSETVKYGHESQGTLT